MPINETNETVVICTDKYRYEFDKENATFSSLKYGGMEYIQSGPQFYAWRPPIDNDLTSWGGREVDQWLNVGLDHLDHIVENVQIEHCGQSAVRIQVNTSVVGLNPNVQTISDVSDTGNDLPSNVAAFDVKYRYHVLGSGDIVVDARVDVNETMQNQLSVYLPRIGLRMKTSNIFDKKSTLRWYGRGPHATYSDRKSSGEFGIHEGLVEDQYVPYLPAQDHGNKTDVEWATLETDDKTAGLVYFRNGEMFDTTVTHFENISKALYPHQLKESDGVSLNIDHRRTGLGTAPTGIRDQHRVDLKEGSWQFAFVIRPYHPDQKTAESLTNRRVPFASRSTDV